MQVKIHEIETWSRDEFVRKQSFESAMVRLDTRLDRIENKIDSLRQHPAE
jgi:hypothetical protein